MINAIDVPWLRESLGAIIGGAGLIALERLLSLPKTMRARSQFRQAIRRELEDAQIHMKACYGAANREQHRGDSGQFHFVRRPDQLSAWNSMKQAAERLDQIIKQFNRPRISNQESMVRYVNFIKYCEFKDRQSLYEWKWPTLTSVDTYT